MLTDGLMFVQFPHPGPEHVPTGYWMDWNRRAHARKFLKSQGQYISGGTPRTGTLAFWGEWEPQSRVIETFAAKPGFPRWLHEPLWRVPRHSKLLQNTDPLVFGDHFLYSNCRQRRNRKLRELAPGSLIVFGSKLGGEFAVDTVFVVGDRAQDFTPETANAIRCEEWVRAVVFDPLRMNHQPASDTFRLYRGRSFEEAPSGPFSFVPCRPHVAGSSAFRRPELRLPRRWLQPNLAMGAKATPATEDEIRQLWNEIVDQVADGAGLALGIQLDAPAHADAELSPQSLTSGAQ